MKKLGEVCETSSGGTPLKAHKDYYENGTIPWLLSGEVAQGNIFKANNFITLTGLKNSSAKLFPENTVLIAMYGATAGQVGILRFEAATNQAICGILPSERFSPEFLYYCFISKKEELVAQAVGGAQPNISQIKVKNTFVPVLPLPEQHRIVSILDEAFTEIDKAKVITEKNLRNAKEVLEGKLESVFSNVSKDWTIKRLEEITNIEYGYTEKAKDKGDYRYIRITDIDKEGNLEPENKMFIEYSKEAEKFVLEDGDLLMARTGATFGKVLLYRDIEKSVFASYLIKISFKENILNKLYWYFSKSRIYWRQASNLSSGAAQPQFNGSALREIIFSFPSSLTDQHDIITELDSISTETKKLEKLYRSKLTHLEELKKSILKQAFEGKL